jgi:hypothetical protein
VAFGAFRGENANYSSEHVVNLNSENDTLQKPQRLNERQLEVWRALRSKAKPNYPFHDWYVGALAVMALADELNPDRLAQAGNSLREILETVPRALETEVSGADRNIFEQSRKSMATAITRAKANYQNCWTGEITKDLRGALEQVQQYVQLRGSPTRAQRTFAGLSKLDPMIEALPGQSRQRKLRRYSDLAKKLESFTHHQCRPNEKELKDCVAQVEDLILDLMAHISADDQNLLCEIIAKGDAVSLDPIQKALQLIDRRGANLASFFQNVAQPVWLKPLQEAGYFSEPPPIVPRDDGFVIPFWWPIIYLKRVVGQASAQVADILLQIGKTDNPRVLDGMVEIISELPVHLAVRLEHVIREYIEQPYHV